MADTDANFDHALRVAGRLLGRPVRFSGKALRGANSSVLCVESENTQFALKLYPNLGVLGTSRCVTEWKALNFMREAGVAAVPAPIAVDPDEAILLQEWLEGERIKIPSSSDVDQACNFLECILNLSSAIGAGEFSGAAESCLSGNAIEKQLETRRNSFAAHPLLGEFFQVDAELVIKRAISHGHGFRYFNEQLPGGLRKLIVADFGFHNALRTRDGNLRFFDFDYFGWDDPVKQLADIIFHPNAHLSQSKRKIFFKRMQKNLKSDETFSIRFYYFAPMFLVRWAYIVLNIFRHDRVSVYGPPNNKLAIARLRKARELFDQASLIVSLPIEKFLKDQI